MVHSTEKQALPLRETLAKGAFVMILVRWLGRSLGVVNIIVLARLLQPGDFGLIAVAMVLYGALQVVFSLSIDAALIRNTEADDEDYNTAWTIGIMQSLLMSGLLVVFAPYMAAHFDDVRVTEVMYVLAISVVLRAFSNIGIVALRKELQFPKIAKFTLLSKILSILVTMALAFYFRSYWALVWGMLSGAVIGIVLSYMFSPYRPRLCVSRFRALWSYSGWMILVNTGMFLAQSGDRYIVGGYVSTQEMGLYSTSADLAEVPTTELVFPISTTLFPGFSKIQHEKERLNAAFLNVIGFIAGLILPVGLGLSLVSNEFIAVFLGSQWLDAGPFLSMLAVFGVCRAIYIMPRNLLVVLRREKLVALMAWLNAFTFLFAAYYSMQYYDLFTLIVAKTGIALIYALISLIVVANVVGLKRIDIVNVLYRPILSAAAMTLVISSVDFPSSLHVVFILLLKSSFGAAIYIFSTLFIWTAAGRPVGFESYIFELVGKQVFWKIFGSKNH